VRDCMVRRSADDGLRALQHFLNQRAVGPEG
jgi:hypothetical protein